MGAFKYSLFSFFNSHSECANTEQIERQVLRERWVQFFQLSDYSNPGRLGGKRERFLCAMPSPFKSSLTLLSFIDCLEIS